MATIYTIGHSTRPIDEFIELLQLHNITQLVDIRTIPKSRHNPQYGQMELEKSLSKRKISYVYLKNLGGLRRAATHSINDAWHNKSFRNYADYMQTAEFARGIEELSVLAQQQTTAIMCAEAVPWRCHRSLVADALTVRHNTVCEIISKNSVQLHKLTKFAVVDGTHIIYPKSAVEDDAENKS